MQPAHQQVVQELQHKARLEDGGAELSADVVGCRLTKTYRSEIRRLLIATTSGAARRMFCEALQALGATLRIGQAPPGGLERAIQRAIDGRDVRDVGAGVEDEPMLE